jgi:hypothetical protein
MTLSANARTSLDIATGSTKVGKEIADAINSGGNPVAATVAAFGATANLTALVPTATSLSDLSTSNTYTDADVNAVFAEVETALDAKADNADVETMRTESEARLDAIESKVNAILTALKNAGLMAT